MSPKTDASAPTRQKLDRAAVVDAAYAVADADGLEAVTIRRLAQDLAVTPMALYWHFKEKDALLAAIADRIWEDVAIEVRRVLAADAQAADSGWRELRCLVEALVTVLRRHPAVAVLAPDRIMACPPGLDATERALALLVAQGCDLRQAAELAHFVLLDAVALVVSEPGGHTDDAEGQDRLRHKRITLASLPPDRYPLVTACAGYLTECEPVSYFAQGIDLIVTGVRELATRR